MYIERSASGKSRSNIPLDGITYKLNIIYIVCVYKYFDYRFMLYRLQSLFCEHAIVEEFETIHTALNKE